MVDVYLTAREIARALKVPPGTIRRWASEDAWPRRRLHGRYAYPWTAVTASYETRNRARRADNTRCLTRARTVSNLES